MTAARSGSPFTHHFFLCATPTMTRPQSLTDTVSLTPTALERIGIRRAFIWITAALVAADVLLAGALVTSRPTRETIVVPPTLIDEKEAWRFTESGPSEAYVARWSEGLVAALATVTPVTAAHQRERILRQTDPTLSAKLETELVLEAQRMKRERISTLFIPMGISVEGLTAHVDGEFTVLMADKVARREMKRFTLTFRYLSGRLLLKTLSTRVLTDAEAVELKRR